LQKAVGFRVGEGPAVSTTHIVTVTVVTLGVIIIITTGSTLLAVGTTA
jgi:hypothetical protein